MPTTQAKHCSQSPIHKITKNKHDRNTVSHSKKRKKKGFYTIMFFSEIYLHNSYFAKKKYSNFCDYGLA